MLIKFQLTDKAGKDWGRWESAVMPRTGETLNWFDTAGNPVSATVNAVHHHYTGNWTQGDENSPEFDYIIIEVG